jgi:electron transfer flavoprotein beta subunit
MVKIAVCTKQIPDPSDPPAFDPSTKRLIRSGSIVLDDSDSYSVEMALRLAEQAGGEAEVTAISVAPDGETRGLRTALAMGVQQAVVISDPALSGLDALGTAKVLAAVIGRVGADLVLAATESTDGYTGTVPAQLAQLLDRPALTFANKVELEGNTLRLHRQTEEGFDEISCPLPAVVTVTAGVVEVRYPTLKGIMSARAKPVEQLTLADLGLDPSTVGAQGARQEVLSIEDVEVRKAGTLVVDDGHAHEAIIDALVAWKVI